LAIVENYPCPFIIQATHSDGAMKIGNAISIYLLFEMYNAVERRFRESMVEDADLCMHFASNLSQFQQSFSVTYAFSCLRQN
jgi:hypothetical protein